MPHRVRTRGPGPREVPGPACGLPMRHFKLTLEYDGTAYHGWQVQPGMSTVQGVLQAVLAQMAGERVTVMGAGRTDAGVHASGQVASFAAALRLDGPTLRRALNANLPRDITVREAVEVAPGFDARRSARSRTYRYTLLRREAPSALWARFSLHVSRPLDLQAMRAGAGLLLGTQDFSAFRAGTCTARTPIRTVHEAVWSRCGDLWRFRIRANAFLQQMVRILVATLLEVGHARHPPEWIAEVLASRDRRAAGKAAPPQGLCLVAVEYDQAREEGTLEPRPFDNQEEFLPDSLA
jgi:tRNA pseudouridine38-40 synthase